MQIEKRFSLIPKLQLIVFLILFGFLGFSFQSVHGDGLAQEMLPPSLIGNRNVTLSIGSSPFFIDNNHTGTQINLMLLDVGTQQPFPEVTLAVSAFKGDQAIFGHIFKSDGGNFILNFFSQTSRDISTEEKSGVLSSFTGQHSGNYIIKGPIFNSGGLYKFKIDVLTMGSYSNQVNKSYNAGISIPEYDKYTVHDNNFGSQQIQIIAYYDQIHDFRYDSQKKFMNFTMPFNWSEDNVGQISVVHQEIQIPRSFGDFMVTRYDAYVNNIKLPDKAITIDDYSSDTSRTIHLILYKENVRELQAQQYNLKQQMIFSLKPNNENPFPIIQFTSNAQFKVSLSWAPPQITAGSTTKFKFQILDPYLINATAGAVSYDFSVIEGNNGVIFHHSGMTSNSTGGDDIDVPFPSNYAGPITVAFENLSGNSFASAEFASVVVEPVANAPKFPVKLDSYSTQGNTKNPGKYSVDLTWFPGIISSGTQAEFVFTIKDKNTGQPLENSSFDFVIIQNGKEVYRNSTSSQSGGSFVDYTFTKNQEGPITIKLENIDNSGESAEESIVIAPEFPFGPLTVLLVLFATIIIFSTLRFLLDLQRS